MDLKESQHQSPQHKWEEERTIPKLHECRHTSLLGNGNKQEKKRKKKRPGRKNPKLLRRVFSRQGVFQQSQNVKEGPRKGRNVEEGGSSKNGKEKTWEPTGNDG